jgi:hypothetical protein
MIRTLRRVRGLVEYANFFSDWRSIQGWRALQMGGGKGLPPVSLRIRGFKAPLYLRPGTSDPTVFHDTFWGKYHRPPNDLISIRTILDLGSNVGYTLADFCRTHPKARILGIELDRGNYEICLRNVQSYSDQCSVIWGAAWHENGEVRYEDRIESGFRVKAGGTKKAPAYS